jgi:hypothetical protein
MPDVSGRYRESGPGAMRGGIGGMIILTISRKCKYKLGIPEASAFHDHLRLQ